MNPHPTPSMKEAIQRRKKRTSPKEQAKRDSQRLNRLPVIPARLQPKRLITTKDYSRFAIWYKDDGGYQRKELTAHANQISDAIRRGSAPPDPIHVAKRRDDDRLWIVDGQQRFWALVDNEKPITAHVHDVIETDDEFLLFKVLNHSKALTANLQVGVHLGPIVQEVLIPTSEDAGHPLYRRIDFAAKGGYKVGAATLVRCVVTLSRSRSADTETMLNIADRYLQTTEGRSRVSRLLKLVGEVGFGPAASDGMIPQGAMCLALSVAWRDSGFPVVYDIKRLRRIFRRLGGVVAANAEERRLLMAKRLTAGFGHGKEQVEL